MLPSHPAASMATHAPSQKPQEPRPRNRIAPCCCVGLLATGFGGGSARLARGGGTPNHTRAARVAEIEVAGAVDRHAVTVRLLPRRASAHHAAVGGQRHAAQRRTAARTREV